MTLENVYNAIDNNSNIDSNVKEDIKELITIFNKTFPNIELSNFAKRVNNLKIEKSNKYLNKRVVKYNHGTNALEFNVDEINKGYDMRHILMHGLLNVISSNDVQSGFNYNDKFKALNAGYTEILANNLVGNDGELSYLDDEVISTNMIASMIGNDVLFESYFSNDTNKLVQFLINEGMDMNAIETMNYHFDNPQAEVDVITRITEIFVSREREETDSFELWASMSPEAEKVLPVINNYKQEMSNQMTGFSHTA